MRRLLSARLLILDEADGVGVEDGETFKQTALRELVEETGLRRENVVARHEVALQLPDGEHVVQDERYFMVRVADSVLSRDDWTELDGRSWSSIAGGRSRSCHVRKRRCGPRPCTMIETALRHRCSAA